MNRHVNRRRFLTTAGALGAGIGLASLKGSMSLAGAMVQAAPHADQLGWPIGCGSWTFHTYTLFEGIDKIAALGLKLFESGPHPKLSKTEPNTAFDENSPPRVLKAVKRKLADCGLKFLSYGDINYSKDPSRKTFDFAKEMGAEIILSEPQAKAFDMLDKLCEEYDIKLAIHDHPKPTRYWNPDFVLKVCRDRSHRIGACCDTGHWLRSGLNPVECIKKLEGRIIYFHFKDLNKAGNHADTHDVPWGTGVCDVPGMLAEVHRQGLKAPFFVEYEYHWETSMPEIAQSIKFFDKVAAELAAK
jgi:sugar phosphate isomerase/epimerase